MRCTLQWCRYKHGLFDLRRASSSEQCQGDTRQFQGGQHEAEPSALAYEANKCVTVIPNCIMVNELIACDNMATDGIYIIFW